MSELQKKENENYHWILHVQINLGSKFQLQQVILIFWRKFPKKDSSGQKQKKLTHPFNSAYLN